MKTQKIYKIRATGAVLETTTATRRCKVNARVLTFGREPVYVEATNLPDALTTDPYLQIDTVETMPPGVIVIDLKSERVQEELAPAPDDDDTPELKSERVQEDLVDPGDHTTNLKSERVQEPENRLKSERVQEPNRKRR